MGGGWGYTRWVLLHIVRDVLQLRLDKGPGVLQRISVRSAFIECHHSEESDRRAACARAVTGMQWCNGATDLSFFFHQNKKTAKEDELPPVAALRPTVRFLIRGFPPCRAGGTST